MIHESCPRQKFNSFWPLPFNHLSHRPSLTFKICKYVTYTLYRQIIILSYIQILSNKEHTVLLLLCLNSLCPRQTVIESERQINCSLKGLALCRDEDKLFVCRVMSSAQCAFTFFWLTRSQTTAWRGDNTSFKSEQWPKTMKSRML